MVQEHSEEQRMAEAKEAVGLEQESPVPDGESAIKPPPEACCWTVIAVAFVLALALLFVLRWWTLGG